MRGEEGARVLGMKVPAEIPPRARRRVFFRQAEDNKGGNTSACAEKSGTGSTCRAASRKYLRVRGEEVSATVRGYSTPEIPPRARRREARGPVVSFLVGNTSACAEKSTNKHQRGEKAGKYLRVRGEELRRKL